MDDGFTGGNIETLRKNLHGLLRPKILNATHFKKTKKNGVLKYEISEEGKKGAVRLKLGEQITCDHLAPLKITKKEILKELEKISVNEANRKMEENIETFMKQFL